MPSLLPVQGISAPIVTNIPDKWDSSWFRSFVVNYLEPMDIRNASAGPGITISSAGTGPNKFPSPALISTSTVVQNLAHEPYLLATAPSDVSLDKYRTIVGASGVVTITDGGPLSVLTVGIATNGVSNSLLTQMPAFSIKGNNTSGASNALDLTQTQVTALLNTFTSLLQGVAPASGGGTVNFLRADGTWASPPGLVTSVSTTDAALGISPTTGNVIVSTNLFTTLAKGVVPASGGGTTNFLRADGTWAAPSYPVAANPSASVGLSVINGSAATFMRSDAAPALSQSISPSWTGNHTYSPSSGIGITINGASGATAFVIAAAAAATAITVTSTLTNFARINLRGNAVAGGSGLIIEQDGSGNANLNQQNAGSLNLFTAGTNWLSLNSTGNLTLNAPSSGVAFNITASGATSNSIKINGATSGQAGISFAPGGSFVAQIGVAGAAGQLITGSATSDFCIDCGNNSLRVSTNNGSSSRIIVDTNGNTTSNGTGSALATGATNGFFYIPTCAGTPTGVPATTYTGSFPMLYDSTNNKLYVYNGAWKGVVLS